MRRGYLRGKVRRIIRRSGAIAVRSLPAALGRGIALGVLVASDGMCGAVPLRDGRKAVVALGLGAADSGMAFPFHGWMGSASSPALLGERPGRAGGGRLRARALPDAHRSGRQLHALRCERHERSDCGGQALLCMCSSGGCPVAGRYGG
jgi:hypothetical protein